VVISTRTSMKKSKQRFVFVSVVRGKNKKEMFMKSFRKWAGIIALMMAAIFALVSCDLLKDLAGDYPEFPKNLIGTWEKGTDTRRIATNTFTFGGTNTRFILSKITGNEYTMRTPAGSSPDLTMTKKLEIENGNLVITGCTQTSCGRECNGTWTKKNK